MILESGALDGHWFLTSKMFEVLDWKIIHVGAYFNIEYISDFRWEWLLEADPENYSRLRVNRPRAINIHAALCAEPQLLHYVNEGRSSTRGFLEFMPSSFINSFYRNLANNSTALNKLPVVACIPIKNILRQLHISRVDIWVLDVEGAEESVLLGTDFKRVHFNTIAMEWWVLIMYSKFAFSLFTVTVMMLPRIRENLIYSNRMVSNVKRFVLTACVATSGTLHHQCRQCNFISCCRDFTLLNYSNIDSTFKQQE